MSQLIESLLMAAGAVQRVHLEPSAKQVWQPEMEVEHKIHYRRIKFSYALVSCVVQFKTQVSPPV